MAYAKKLEQHNVQGGWMEFGQVSIDPASIAANAQGVETFTLTGAKTGDMVFANAQALGASVALVGAKVTAANTISLYYNNTIDSTTAKDIPSHVVDVMLIHLS